MYIVYYNVPTLTGFGGAGAEGFSFRWFANSMDGWDGFLEPLVIGEVNPMLTYTKYKLSNNILI